MTTPAVAPLSPEDAVAPQLHKRLRDKIISCELPPGRRISETEIAATYAVSRQPVREAFIKLSEENLVSIRPQRGTYIRRIPVGAALTARFMREAIEADLVRRLAGQCTPFLLVSLEAQIDHQKAAAEVGDPVAFMRLDEAFHRLLAAGAGVPAVSDYLDGLNIQMNRVRNLTAREFSPGKLIVQHADIVAAIRKGDAMAADAAMRTHLQEINKDLPQIIKTYPDYFDGTEALS